jgi:hypothetical protein
MACGFVMHQDILATLKITSTFNCVFSFQVDANSIFVDYAKIALDPDYAQAASNIRVAATYVIK